MHRLLAFLLFFAPIISFAQVTESNKTNPDWDATSDWTNGAPGYTTSKDARLIHDSQIKENLDINDTLWIVEELTVDQKNITIQSGGVLIIDGTVTINQGELIVEDSGAVYVNGELNGDKSKVTIKKGTFVVNAGAKVTIAPNGELLAQESPSTITVDGTLFVTDFTLKVTVTGSGVIIVDGTFNNDGGTVFGCTTSGTGCCTSLNGDCYLGNNINATFISIKSGEWKSASTWNLNAVPTDGSEVEINTGDSVTLKAGGKVFVNKLTVDSGAYFFQNNRDLEVNGNYFVDGIHEITKAEFEIDTDTSYISGTGEVKFEGNSDKTLVQIKGGVAIFSDTSNVLFFGLGVNGGLVIEDTVYNYGETEISCNVSDAGLNGIIYNQPGGDLFVYAPSYGIQLYAKDSGNAVHYSDVTAQNIAKPIDSTYYTLILGGGNVKSLTSNLTITNMRIESELDVTTNNYDLIIKGYWDNHAGTFNEREGKVTFSGSNEQRLQGSIGVETFYDLTINKSAQTLFFNNINVLDTFKMESGNIYMFDNTLTLGSSTSSTGYFDYTSGIIYNGIFDRWVTAASSGVVYPVGLYPYDMSLTFTSSSITAGRLGVRFDPTFPGNAGSPWTENSTTYGNTFSDGLWDLIANNSFASTDYSVSVRIADLQGFPIGGDERLLYRVNSANNWSFSGSHGSNNSTTVSRTGVSGIGQFALADTNSCTKPAKPTFLSSDTDVCRGDTNVLYAVNDLGFTYLWSIDNLGGTSRSQTSNTDTNYIDWDVSGGTYTVKVQAYDSTCGSSDFATVDVNVRPFTITEITGRSTVAEGTTSEPYHVTEYASHTYEWDVVGGSISFGANTDSITVDYLTQGSGRVQCKLSYSGCTEIDSVTKDITLFQTYVSESSGSYSTNSIWVGGATPPDSADVRISEGHTVTLDGNKIIKRLIVEGSLNNQSNNLKVLELYQIDGTHTDQGSGTTTTELTSDSTNGFVAVIAGKGTSTLRKLEITNGVWEIAEGFNISIDADSLVIDAATLQNKGTLKITDDIQKANSGQFLTSFTSSSVFYNGTAQTVIAPDDAYHSLTLSNSGSKTFGDNLEVNGNLSVLGTATVNANSKTLELSGIEVQTVSSTTDLSLVNLTIDNFSGGFPGVSFNRHLDISGTLNMNDGHVKSDNSIHLSSTASITGGNVSSYVEGTLARDLGNASSSYLFPVGVDSIFAPIEIDPAAIGTFSASYNYGSPADTTTDTSFAKISTVEYWTINDSNNVDADFLRLYYPDATRSGITTPSEIAIARFDGSDWKRWGWHTGTNATTGTNTYAYIQVTDVTDFSPFTFGDLNGNNPLPLELLYLSANWINDKTVQLTWATASQINVDYMELEYSIDGVTFQPIHRIDHVENSNSINTYEYKHQPSLQAETIYYRLRSTDLDGSTEYSNVVDLSIDQDKTPSIEVFPNPSYDGRVVINLRNLYALNSKIELIDLKGQVVYSEGLNENSSYKQLDLSPFYGAYLLKVSSQELILTKKILIQH